MWLFSYFWDSETHLEIFSLVFESAAAFVEALIAVWIWKTLKAIDSEPTEENEHKKESLEATFALIAAVFALVAVCSVWRILVLHNRSEKDSEAVFETQSNKLAQAQAKVLELEVKTSPRTITPEQQKILIKMLLPASNEIIKFSYSNASLEQKEYAEKLSGILTNAGFKLEISAAAFSSWPDLPESGLSLEVKSNTEHPANANSIENAFTAANIPHHWYGNTNLSQTYFLIFVGTRPTGN
jgi:hypothetical protein